MADYTEEIAQLEQIVNGAIDSVTTDGTTTKFSIAQARKRLSELRAEDDTAVAAGKVRRRVRRANLGSAW